MEFNKLKGDKLRTVQHFPISLVAEIEGIEECRNKGRPFGVMDAKGSQTALLVHQRAVKRAVALNTIAPKINPKKSNGNPSNSIVNDSLVTCSNK